MIAEVWEGLQNRNDISSVLREIIGQHTLDLLHLKVTTFDSFRPILWIKALFDLQRTYLQATAGAQDCPVPGLLPTELIFSSLMYLLHVKTKLFPAVATPDQDWAVQRLLLAHTLLSGVRLLLLRNEFIEPAEVKRLERALEAVWHEKNLPETEHFIISELLPEALDMDAPSEDQAGRDYATSLRQVGVPSFADGLVSLIRVEVGHARAEPSTVPAVYSAYEAHLSNIRES